MTQEDSLSVKDVNYANYGGRGITICNDWINDFNSFQAWALANGYKETLTLDRIDVNGNYEPNNCRWSTMKIQQNNRTNNRVIEFNGQRKTITQWAEEYGMSYRNLYYRLSNGYTIKDALEKQGRLSRCKR